MAIVDLMGLELVEQHLVEMMLSCGMAYSIGTTRAAHCTCQVVSREINEIAERREGDERLDSSEKCTSVNV